MLSGRGLCDELITHPEESYRLCCVVVCDLENLVNEEVMTRVGSQRHRKKKVNFLLSVWILSVNKIPPENMWASAIGNERRMERNP